MDRKYLYWHGLLQASNELTGTERILMGIRPYGFHAGNTLSLLAYPYLLCDFLKKRGVEPQFKFVVSINDWEQSDLQGKDIYEYPFDVRPTHTTLAHALMKDGVTAVKYWQPKIELEILQLKSFFPKITISFVKNSELQKYRAMKNTIFNTIKNFQVHKKILLATTDERTVGNESRFCNALCSRCLSANTNTLATMNDKLESDCESCGLYELRPYDKCDFWLYYKQLFPTRMAIFKFDLVISGNDHYIARTLETSKALYRHIYNTPMPPIGMLYAPLVIAKDGQKMSKSRGNTQSSSLGYMIERAKEATSDTIVV